MSGPPALPASAVEEIARAAARAVAKEVAEAAASAAAEAAIAKTLRGLGIDPNSSSAVVDWHADQRWVRRARIGSETVTTRGRNFIAVATSIGTALAFTLWQLFGDKPPTP